MRYGLIGEKLGHSFSKLIHEQLCSYTYDLIPLRREEVDGFLTRRELELLPLGIRVITCELAMRFLTDYIDGDLYFKVKSPEHNLVRARAQMRLLEDVERKYDEILRTVRGML